MTKLCKIRVLHSLDEVFPKYRPVVGKVYDAEYCPKQKRHRSEKMSAEFCIVPIRDKRIILRKNEFEIVGGNQNA